MSRTITYQEAREVISNGDIIHVFIPKKFALKSLLYSGIWFFTGSEIYHNGVALWMTSPSGEKRLMIVEANMFAGKRILPLSTYSSHRITVQLTSAKVLFTDMEPALMSRVNIQPYSLYNLVSIGLKEFFNTDIGRKGTGQVCSELCASALIAGGIQLPSIIVSPGKLFFELCRLGFTDTINVAASDPAPDSK